MSKKKYFRVTVNPAAKDGCQVPPRKSTIAPKQSGSPPNLEVSPAQDARRLKQAYVYQYRLAQQCHHGPRLNSYVPSTSFDRAGTWRRVAEKLRAEGIDPVRYVTVLLCELRKRGMFFDHGVAASRSRAKQAAQDIACELKRQGQDDEVPKPVYLDLEAWDARCAPTPAQLDSVKMLQLYHETVEKGANTARMALSIQMNIAIREISYLQFAGKLSKADSCSVTLMTACLELSPLFRHGLATSMIEVPASSPELERNNTRFKKIADRFFEGACFQFLTNAEGYLREWRSILSPTVERGAESLYLRRLDELEM